MCNAFIPCLKDGIRRCATVPHGLSASITVRFWTCDNCQTKHDRDINAAINLRDEGLRILTSGTGDKACCPDVSRSNRGRKKSTAPLSVGQEAYTVPSGQCR